MTDAGGAEARSINAQQRTPEGVRTGIMRLLALASFSVYAIMVLSLHQERVVPFQVEETGALQAATSHWRYRTPLGSIDSSLRQYFFDRALALHVPAEQAVEEAIHGS